MKENRNWPVRVLLGGIAGVFFVLFRQYVWPNVKLVLMDWKLLSPFSLLVLFIGFSLLILGLALERRMKIAESSKRKGYTTLILALCFFAPFIYSIVVDFLLEKK